MSTFFTPAELADFRDLQNSALADACRITPQRPPGVSPVPVNVACAVTLPATGGNGIGQPVGYGGALPPMARIDDVQIVFPLGTAIETGDRIDWLTGGRTYTAGQQRKALSYDLNVTVAVVEVGS